MIFTRSRSFFQVVPNYVNANTLIHKSASINVNVNLFFGRLPDSEAATALREAIRSGASNLKVTSIDGHPQLWSTSAGSGSRLFDEAVSRSQTRVFSWQKVQKEIQIVFVLKFYSFILRLSWGHRVVDPYSFFTDPDPDPVDPYGGQYGSGSNTDPGL